MKHIRRLRFVGILMCVFICSCARYPSIPEREEIQPSIQASRQAPPAPSATPVSVESTVAEDYRIGPEDILEVKIWGHGDLSRNVSVSQNGDFSFPLIGRVKAAGRTLEALEKELTVRLADGYLVKPQVTVTVAGYKSKKVYVVGEVKRSGTFSLTGPTSVVELLSWAGGVTENAGTEVLVIRPREPTRKKGPLTLEEAGSSEVISLDLRAIQEGDVSHNIRLRNADTVMVPKAKYFYVFGEVNRPGQFKHEHGISVLKAITIAGGLTEKAAGKRTRIVREKEGVRVEMRARMSDVVQPNDIVVVPESFF